MVNFATFGAYQTTKKMNEFTLELRAVLDEYYIAPNGRPIGLMENRQYIDGVKEKYIQRVEPKIQELIKKSHEFGYIGEAAIRGVVSDVFFSYFQEDI